MKGKVCALKIIEITGERSPEIDTEIRFNIATERAAGEELVRFDIKSGEVALRHATRVLRRMKSEGAVQVLAFRESFAAGDTEASYISNKYGDTLGELPEGEFVYIKL